MITQARSGEYDAHGSMSDADCVIGPSFGYRKTAKGVIEPGRANTSLARFAATNLLALPKILQFEIDDAYEQLTGVRSEHRIEQHRKKGKYLDTREVAAQAVAVMRENGWGRAVLLGHPNHMPRIDSVVQNLGAATVVPENIEAVWDTESDQPWTRSPEAWKQHELVAIGLYAVRGWLASE
jgi:hypothetical protein